MGGDARRIDVRSAVQARLAAPDHDVKGFARALGEVLLNVGGCPGSGANPRGSLGRGLRAGECGRESS